MPLRSKRWVVGCRHGFEQHIGLHREHIRVQAQAAQRGLERGSLLRGGQAHQVVATAAHSVVAVQADARVTRNTRHPLTLRLRRFAACGISSSAELHDHAPHGLGIRCGSNTQQQGNK